MNVIVILIITIVIIIISIVIITVIIMILTVIMIVIITTLSSVPGTANMGGTEAIAKAESSRGL